jgi:DNA adenine methylase
VKEKYKSKASFLKWAGGKRSIIQRIKAVLPDGKRLVEPFCGSATVFLNTEYKDNLIADNNSDLINIFLHLQNEGSIFIDYCRQYFIAENNDAEKYYKFRTLFNETQDKKQRAALFLYMNKHGYNGLCRYNSRGGFNVPFGKHKKVTFPENNLDEFLAQAKYATFVKQDFETTLSNAGQGDVIYCDPPYVPLNASNSSFQYEKNGFSVEQQERLAQLAEKTAARGIPVLISNHFTDFTREIYNKAHLSTFNVRRQISCKADQRKQASEVLALYKA